MRTNYFQPDANGGHKSYISLKLSTHDIPDLPPPKPAYEIFVYSPRVEGVHLRNGKIAQWRDYFDMNQFQAQLPG